MVEPAFGAQTNDLLDDGGEGGSYSSKTDSREKRNQGQSDFLRQKIW
jgi:hypothetical protein